MTLPSQQRAGSAQSSIGEALGTILARVRFWAPVWVPLIVFAQIALLGLRPALAEKQRVDTAHEELVDTERVLAERAEELELELRAERDPIYRERVRRAQRDPATGADAQIGAPETPGIPAPRGH